MRILVCVKRVFEADAALQIESSGAVRPRGEPSRYQLSRYDEYAVEEAVRLKEALPGTHVEAITVGPPGADSVLERAMGMGADRGIRLRVDDDRQASRGAAVARAIAACARGRGYGLILCGVMSEDQMRGQVGPAIAEHLGWPCATAAVAVTLRAGPGRVAVAREIEAGWRARVELALPAVVTVQSGINRPRYPALSSLLRARRQTWETLDASGFDGSAPTVALVGARRPGRSRTGRVLEGEPRAKARALLALLAERSLLRDPEAEP